MTRFSSPTLLVLVLTAALTGHFDSGTIADAQVTAAQVTPVQATPVKATPVKATPVRATPVKARAHHVFCSKGEKEVIPKALKPWAKTLRMTGYNVFRVAGSQGLTLKRDKAVALKLPAGLGSGSLTLQADGRVVLALRNAKKEKVAGARSPLPLANLVRKLKNRRGEIYLLVVAAIKKS